LLPFLSEKQVQESHFPRPYFPETSKPFQITMYAEIILRKGNKNTAIFKQYFMPETI
jgi:hypothetical protein